MGSQSSDDRFETAKTLLNYGFANYESVPLTVDESLITDVNVIRGAEESLKPAHDEIKSITLKKGEKSKITTEISLATDAEAPIEKGQTLGSIKFCLGGETISECRLFSDSEIRRTTYGDVLKAMLKALTN